MKTTFKDIRKKQQEEKRMCKIIQFPVKESNGYKNLVALFNICDTVESCNFYLESVEWLFQSGNITEKELYTLRRIGRQKRLKLVTPEQGQQRVEKPGRGKAWRNWVSLEPEECRGGTGFPRMQETWMAY